MGTPCEIEVYSYKDESAAIDAAFTELHHIDALLSNWSPDSDLMKLNRAAGAAREPRPWIVVPHELFGRIAFAVHVAEATDGKFDPTVGPLIRAYGFLPSTTSGSELRSLADLRSRVGWEKVKLDSKTSAIQFASPGMEIDLGGIAKGYAAGRAALILRQQGIHSALVSLGGSSITAIGTPPEQSGWRLLIRDPRDGKTPAAAIDLHDGESLASSGTYENTKGEGKDRRSHIVDPRTGRAIGGSTGVTVLASDAELADALTKPFFFEDCCSSADWAKWLASFENASIILLRARRGRLERITGGAHPERFETVAIPGNGHAAKANRRSAQHFARDGEGSAGYPAFSSEASRVEAYRSAGYHPADFP